MTSTGAPATAEIQANKITFSPTDTVFRDVVEQIVEAVNAGNLEDPNPHPLAIATAQSSRQIDGAYHEVLLWARHSESPDAFFRKLAHDLQYLTHQFRVQRRGSLVEEHEHRVHRQGAGNGDALLLPTG